MSPAPLPDVSFEAIVRLCTDPEERDKWSLFKSLPSLFRAQSLDDLTEEEVTWFRVQLAIDHGFGECPSCKRFGYGPHCTGCGHLMSAPLEEYGECMQCRAGGVRMIVREKFCSRCGTPTEDAMFWADLKGGKLDYATLNEKFRTPVSAEEKRAIEEATGGAHWDAEGKPRAKQDGRPEGQARVRLEHRRSKRRR